MAKAPKPHNPGGSSVSDMLRSKHKKKDVTPKIIHGATALHFEGVPPDHPNLGGHLEQVYEALDRNISDAAFDIDMRESDEGWQAGGGNTDILGDAKGPPVPSKKIPDKGAPKNVLRSGSGEPNDLQRQIDEALLRGQQNEKDNDARDKRTDQYIDDLLVHGPEAANLNRFGHPQKEPKGDASDPRASSTKGGRKPKRTPPKGQPKPKPAPPVIPPYRQQMAEKRVVNKKIPARKNPKLPRTGLNTYGQQMS